MSTHRLPQPVAVAVALLVIAVGVGAAGCSSSNDGSALGNGSFSYVCASASTDPYCKGKSGNVPLPPSVAVGTQFTLVYVPNNSGAYPSVQLAPVSDAFFQPRGGAGDGNGAFVAVRAGSPAFYVTAGGLVIDYATLKVTP